MQKKTNKQLHHNYITITSQLQLQLQLQLQYN